MMNLENLLREEHSKKQTLKIVRYVGHDQNKFNQLLSLAGVGYQITPSLILLAGPGWILSREVNGQWRHEQRLWQQLGWNITDQINSRTRLEERRDTSQPGIAWRFRERLWLRHPIAEWSSHSLSFFDEMLFNVNSRSLWRNCNGNLDFYRFFR